MSEVEKTPPPPGVTEFPDVWHPPFHRALGVRMGLNDEHHGVAWVNIDPELHYGNRWAHGGLVGALADISSGITVARHAGGNPMEIIDGTIDLKVNFLRKVVEGDLVATARPLHSGKRVFVTEVDLENGGRLCAKAIATFMLRRPES